MEFRVESSPSGRSSCRGCKEKIPKGDLRLAEEYASPFSSDNAWRYWHLGCAVKKLPTELGAALKGFAGEVPDRAALEESLATASKKVKAKLDLPAADRAPTARAKCISCGIQIDKGALRVGVEREVETPMGSQRGAGYLHAKCAVVWVGSQIDSGECDWEDADDFLAAILNNSGLASPDEEELRTGFGG